MSYLGELTKAQKCTQSVYHAYLMKIESNKEYIHLFFEGDEDVSFYTNFVKTELGIGEMYIPYCCGVKDDVYETRERVLEKSPNANVIFFVDKDWSDFLNEDYPDEDNIYVTNYYSIENYFVTNEMVRRIWYDIYHLHGLDDELSQVLDHFVNQLQKFYNFSLFLSAWILVLRRNGERPNYRGINLNNICVIDEDLEFNEIDDRIEFLERVCQVASPPQIDIDNTIEELQLHAPKNYIRGKFELWFLVAFLNRLEEVHTLRVHTRINTGNVIEILGPRLDCPKSLEDFLSKFKPSVNNEQADVKSWLERFSNLVNSCFRKLFS